MVTKVSRKIFGELAEAILLLGAKRATKYLSPKLTVKATFRGRRDKRDRQAHVLFTVGSPNYAERTFIRQAQTAGEPFPIRRILLKWPKEK